MHGVASLLNEREVDTIGPRTKVTCNISRSWHGSKSGKSPRRGGDGLRVSSGDRMLYPTSPPQLGGVFTIAGVWLTNPDRGVLIPRIGRAKPMPRGGPGGGSRD